MKYVVTTEKGLHMFTTIVHKHESYLSAALSILILRYFKSYLIPIQYSFLYS